MTEAQPIARVIKKIVFGYDLEFFPGSLILATNQLKRKLARAGFDIAVSNSPLSDLPPDVDILFVPPELAEVGRQAAPGRRVEVLDTFLNHPAYDRLIQQLEEGCELTAARLGEHLPSDEQRKIVRYRGYERIE